MKTRHFQYDNKKQRSPNFRDHLSTKQRKKLLKDIHIGKETEKNSATGLTLNFNR